MPHPNPSLRGSIYLMPSRLGRIYNILIPLVIFIYNDFFLNFLEERQELEGMFRLNFGNHLLFFDFLTEN